MATVTTNDKHYSDIANAIRLKNHSEEHYTPAQMADAICEACDIQYQMGKEDGHVIISGYFIPEQDSNSINLAIPAGAKIVEIIPEEEPSAATATRFPVYYLYASEAFQKNNWTYKDRGALVQYMYGTKSYISFYAFHSDGGFSATFDEELVFEAGRPYRWTAHYWQEEAAE